MNLDGLVSEELIQGLIKKKSSYKRISKKLQTLFPVWTYIWGPHDARYPPYQLHEGSEHFQQVSQRRISKVLRDVAPHAHEERTHDLLDRTNPIAYNAHYFGYKLHMDQNEKLAQVFGVTHVHAVDGCSRIVVGFITIPKKNPILIYQYLFRPLLVQYGLFDQLRVDHGTEFCLCIFVQELLKNHRCIKDRAPWRQTASTKNYRAERLWPEEKETFASYKSKGCRLGFSLK